MSTGRKAFIYNCDFTVRPLALEASASADASNVDLCNIFVELTDVSDMFNYRACIRGYWGCWLPHAHHNPVQSTNHQTKSHRDPPLFPVQSVSR